MRVYKQPRLPLGPPRTPIVELADLAADDPEVARGTSWIEVALLDRRGHPFSEAKMRISPPYGGPLEVTTDARGQWKLEEIPQLGTWGVQVPETVGRADSSQSVALQGDEPEVRIGKDPVRLRAGRAHRLVVLPPLARFSV